MNARVDVRKNLRMVLQHVVICGPDATVEAAIREVDDAVAELIEAAKECEARLAIHIKHTEDMVAHMRICAALARIGAD